MIFFLFLGLFIGSFLNVLIHRVPKKESFLIGRSYCDYCKKTLAWYDLIPLVSFIVLKGRCRLCNRKINLQIFLVELITALLFASYYLKVQTIDLNLLVSLLIISGLIVIFFTDLNNGIIPDKILAPMFFLVLITNFNTNHLISGLSSLVFFLLIFILSKGKAMGFGDVKFAGVLGTLLGFPLSLISFYLSFLTGGITSLILVLWGKKKLKKDTIPFGPFLSLGALLSIFLGDLLVSLLLNFLPL